MDDMKNEVIFIQDMQFEDGMYQVLMPSEIQFIPQIGSTCNLQPQMLGKVKDVAHFEKHDDSGTAINWETYVWLETSETFKNTTFNEAFLEERPEFKKAELIWRSDNKVKYSLEDGFQVIELKH